MDWLPVEVLESLPLLHLCMKSQGADFEVSEQVDQSPDAVDRVAKDQGSTRVLGQHVIQVLVLLCYGATDSGLDQRLGGT